MTTDKNNYSEHILKFTTKQPVICPYCRKNTIFHNGLWRCHPCNALAKANKETKQPLGTMANQKLWNARRATYKSFGLNMQTYIIQGLSKNQARKKVIHELSSKLNIRHSEFNIECFDEVLCNAVIHLLSTMNNSCCPLCPYCKKTSEFIESKKIYRCEPCDAQVGVHKHNNKPLGSLANAELREARKKAHAFFDPLWHYKIKRDSLSTSKARKSAYTWLAGKMNLSIEECHIAEFNIEQCLQVVELCQPYIQNAMYNLAILNEK